MTLFLALLYVAAAGLELAGVWLVVADIRESRRRWDAYQADIEREDAAMAADLLFRTDPMVSRYGFNPMQMVRAINTVDSLVGVDRRRQNWAVRLLVGGIVLGLVGNLLSLIAA